MVSEINHKFKVGKRRFFGNELVWRRSLLVLFLFGCENVDQTRNQHHDDLRHQGKLNKDQAVEEALRIDWERQAVYVVESHGWKSQGQGSGSPRQGPSAGLPVQGQPQTKNGPAVPGQGGERGCVQTDPLGVAAPFLSQSYRPLKRKETQADPMRWDACDGSLDLLRCSPGEVDAELLQAGVQHQSAEQQDSAEAEEEQQGAPFWHSAAKKNSQNEPWKESALISEKQNHVSNVMTEDNLSKFLFNNLETLTQQKNHGRRFA